MRIYLSNFDREAFVMLLMFVLFVVAVFYDWGNTNGMDEVLDRASTQDKLRIVCVDRPVGIICKTKN
jgi:hypothetical protein